MLRQVASKAVGGNEGFQAGRSEGSSGAISFEAHTQSYCVGGLAGTARLAGSFSITTGVWGMYLDAQASITRAA